MKATPYTPLLRQHEREAHAALVALHAALLLALAAVVLAFFQAMQRDQPTSLLWLYEKQRLRQLTDRIAGAVGDYEQRARDLIAASTEAMRDLADTIATQQLQAIDASATAPGHPPLAPVRSTRMDSMVADTIARVRQVLTLAVTGMVTLPYAQNRIREALDRLRSIALLVLVDELYRAFRDLLLDWYQVNGATVSGWIWRTAEDTHVCPVCDALDGSWHPLTEEMQEPHPGCRCEPEPAGGKP